jgi:ATP-binding cassette, subfamily B, bacterial
MKSKIFYLKWVFSFTKECRLSYLSSKMLPFFVNFAETGFEALSFKELFLCFSNKDVNNLYYSLGYFILAMIIASMGQGFTSYISTYSNSIFKAKVKGEFINKTLKLSILNMGEHSGEDLAKLNQDVDMACDGLNNFFDAVLIPFLEAIAFLALVFTVTWQIGSFYIVSLIPICLLNYFYSDKFHIKGMKIQENLTILNEKFQDIIKGAMTIKVFTLEEVMEEEVKDLSKEVLASKMEEQSLRVKYSFIANIFSHTFVTFPIIIGCYLVSVGTMVLPDVMFVSRYTYAIRYLVTSLITSATDLPIQIAGIRRLYEVFKKSNEGEYFGKELTIKNTESIIEFKDLKVTYREANIIENFNLNIKKGESIALVGPSGSGKSTIIKTIMQFAPYEGEIFYYGKKEKAYDLTYLRNMASYVSQESDLFEGTIYENILYGNMNATEEEVKHAAILAFADEFIVSLKDGYNTNVGENGNKLSGGEKQRICIARAFLKNAPIILLDEATSALDIESEAYVQKAINNLMVGRTIIIVAHRLSTIKNVDRILVIKDGKIIEEGNHENLLEKEGLYKELYSLQL